MDIDFQVFLYNQQKRIVKKLNTMEGRIARKKSIAGDGEFSWTRRGVYGGLGRNSVTKIPISNWKLQSATFSFK